jgi:hypothetical protein
MAFDVVGARRAGYSDVEIAQYLAEQRKFNLQGALEAGYRPEEVLNYLVGKDAPKEPAERGSFLDAARDIPLALGRGVAGGVRSIADVFGTENVASEKLRELDESLTRLQSASAKRDYDEIARIMRDAEDKGFGAQVGAAVKSLGVAPGMMLAQGVGSIAPTAAASIAAAPFTGGASLLAIPAAVGAVQGVGTVKGSVRDAVYEEFVAQGVPEDQAAAAAEKAQSYSGGNLDTILTGGVLGALAGATGIEKTVGNAVTRALTKRVAEEAAGAVATRGVVGAGTRGFAKEASTEALQGGQERLAQNVALQREGVDTPTMRGVVASGALEGIVGGILGAGVDVTSTLGGNTAIRDRDAKIQRATEFVRTTVAQSPTDENVAEAVRLFQDTGATEPEARSVVLTALQAIKDRGVPTPSAAPDAASAPVAGGVGPSVPSAGGVGPGGDTGEPSGVGPESVGEPVPPTVVSAGAPAAVDSALKGPAAARAKKVTLPPAPTLVSEVPEAPPVAAAPEVAAPEVMPLEPVREAPPPPAPSPPLDLTPVYDAPNMKARKVAAAPVATAAIETLGVKNAGTPVVQQVTNQIAQRTARNETFDPLDVARKVLVGKKLLPEVSEVATKLQQAAEVRRAQLLSGTSAAGLPVTQLPEGVASGVAGAPKTTDVAKADADRIRKNTVAAASEFSDDRSRQSFFAAVNGALGDDTFLYASEAGENDIDPRAYARGLQFVKEQGGPDKVTEFYTPPSEIDYAAREDLPTTDRPLTGEDRRVVGWTETLKRARNAQSINDAQYSHLLDMVESGTSSNKLRAELALAKNQATGEAAPASGVVAYQRPADVEVGTDYPGGRLLRRFSPEMDAKREKVASNLRARLDKLGLSDVAVKVPDQIRDVSESNEFSVEALYLKKTIEVALDGTDNFDSLNHEALHALRKLNLFTDREWATLSERATDEWLAKYDIARRYGDLSPEAQIEEAVAEAFKDYAKAGTSKESGVVRRAFNAVREFMRAVRDVFTRSGLDTPDKIFASVERGEVGARERGQQEDAELPSEQRAVKTPTLREAIRRLQVDEKKTSDGVRRLARSQGAFYGSSGQLVQRTLELLDKGFGATVEGHDPTPLPKTDFQKLPEPFFRQVVNALPTTGLIGWVREAAGPQVAAPLEDLQRVLARLDGEKNRLRREYTEIADRLAKFVDKSGQRELAQVYANRIDRIDPTSWPEGATLAQVLVNDAPAVEYNRLLADPTTPAENKARLQKGLEKRTKELSSAYTNWQALGKQEGGHAIYKELIEFYRKTYQDRRTAMDNVLRGLGLDAEATEKLIASIRNEMEKSRKDARKSDDAEQHPDIDDALFPEVYVPLNRYGDFWLRVSAKNGKSREFYTFETEKQRDEFLAGVAAERGLSLRAVQNRSYEDTGISWGNDIKALQASFSTETEAMKAMIKKVEEAATAAEAKGETLKAETVRDQLYQVLLMTAPERSIRKHYLHADFVTGFSTDVKHGFMDSAAKNANELANLRYRQKVDAELDRFEELTKDQPLRGRLQSVYTNMKSRADSSMAPNERGTFVDNINRMAFIYYLTSAATAIVNTTSLPIRVMPRLASEYGYAAATAKAVKFAQVWKSVGVKRGEAFIPVTMETSPLVTRSAANKWAFNELVNHGAFEGADTAILRNRRTLQPGSAARNLQEVGDFTYRAITSLFNMSETLTRQASAMMTFELEYEKLKKAGVAEDAAREGGMRKALDISNDALGNYSEFERPPVMKGELGRSLFLFKMYSVNTTRFFVSNLRAIFGNRPVAEKAKALNELSGVLLTGALFHGLTGMPLYSLMTLTLDLLHKMFDDDEDRRARIEDNPYTADSSDARFRMDWLPEHFGNPSVKGLDGRLHTLANMIEYGPLSELSDLNFSSRTSFNGLWFREPQPSESAEEQMVNTVVANVPFASMFVGFGRAVDHFNNGRITRGLEALSPAFSRGAFTSYRIGTEGVESLRGDKIVQQGELNNLNLVGQILGLQPTLVADAMRERSEVIGVQNSMDRKRSALMGRLNRALANPEGGQDAVIRAVEAIRKHNDKYPNPVFQIDQEDAESSFKTFMRNTAQTYRGVTFTKKEAPYILSALGAE